MRLEVVAPAKVNLGLEILGRRDDGYHEIVTVMHTIDLADEVRLSDADRLELVVAGEAVRGVPSDGLHNLAYAAARALTEAAGGTGRGARIELVKNIPAGMGLGGGSTDAAAVLRGLNHLWRLGFSAPELSEIGAGLGSDVPFFIAGGAALVTGRGERVEALPDAPAMALTVFVSEVELTDKTRQMYARITPADYSDGAATHALAERLRRGLPPVVGDLRNAFDAHARAASEGSGRAMAMLRDAGFAVLTCGSGPALFTPIARDDLPPALLRALELECGMRAIGCLTLGREAALRVREV